jgi:hypothetical protein
VLNCTKLCTDPRSNSCPVVASYLVELPGVNRSVVPAFTTILLTFNFTSIYDSPLGKLIQYNDHFQLAIRLAGESTPRALPPYLANNHGQPRIVPLALHMLLQDAALDIRIELLHGLFKNEVVHFRDLVTAKLLPPTREDSFPERLSQHSQFWSILVQNDPNGVPGMDLPLNVPAAEETGVLIDFVGNQTDAGSLIAPGDLLESSSSVDQLQTYWRTAQAAQQTNGMLALNFLPYFSSCVGYDSRLTLSQLMQQPEKFLDGGLVSPPEDIGVVSQFDFFGVPHADNFTTQMTCQYEETLTTSSTSRWFEFPTGTALFYLTANAFPATQYRKGAFNGYSTINGLIPVTVAVDETATFESSSTTGTGGASTSSSRKRFATQATTTTTTTTTSTTSSSSASSVRIPTVVQLDIEYFQRDSYQKQLITATITFKHFVDVPSSYYSATLTTASGAKVANDYPSFYVWPDTSQPSPLLQYLADPAAFTTASANASSLYPVRLNQYKLIVTMKPMDWLTMMNSFVFDIQLYMVLFLGILGGGLVWRIALWILHKAWHIAAHMISVKYGDGSFSYPVPLRFKALASLWWPPVFIGFLVAAVPFAIIVMIIILLFVSAYPMSSASGEYTNVLTLSTTQITQYRIGRMGAAFMFAGLLIFWEGVKVIVPDNRDVHVMGKQTEMWRPVYWKRMRYLAVTIFHATGLMWILEFSYSYYWSVNVVACVYVLKFGQMMIEQYYDWWLGEQIYVCMLVVQMEWMQYIVTFGAENM